MDNQITAKHKEGGSVVITTKEGESGYSAIYNGKEYRSDKTYDELIFSWLFLSVCKHLYFFENEGPNLVLIHETPSDKLVFYAIEPNLALEFEKYRECSQQLIINLSKRIDSFEQSLAHQRSLIDRLEKEIVSMQGYKNLAIGSRVYCWDDNTLDLELTNNPAAGTAFDNIFSRGIEHSLSFGALVSTPNELMIELCEECWANVIEVTCTDSQPGSFCPHLAVSHSLSGTFTSVCSETMDRECTARFQAARIKYIKLTLSRGTTKFTHIGSFSVRHE